MESSTGSKLRAGVRSSSLYRDFHGQGEQEKNPTQIGTGKALTYDRELRSRAGPMVHGSAQRQCTYVFLAKLVRLSLAR